MFSLDLAGAAVKLYQVIRQDRELFEWARLVGSTHFSGLIAFLVTAGTTHSVWNGLTAAGLAIFAVILAQPKGRTLTIGLPRAVVEQYQAQVKDGITTIREQKD